MVHLAIFGRSEVKLQLFSIFVDCFVKQCLLLIFLVILYVLSIGTFPFLEDSGQSVRLGELVKQGLSNTHFVQLSSLSVLLRSIIKRYSIVFISDPHQL